MASAQDKRMRSGKCLQHCAKTKELWTTHFNNRWGDWFSSLISIFHVSLQVDIKEFEDEVQLLVCMYDIKEAGMMWKKNY